MSKVAWVVSILIIVNLIVFGSLYLIDKEKYLGWLFTFSYGTQHIIHFNDLFDITKASPWVEQVLKYQKSASTNVFSGNIMSPSLESNTQKGSQFLKMIEMIGFEYSVPGTHETDFGNEEFKQFVAHTPNNNWLLCNLRFKSNNTIYGGLPEYAIQEKNGLKIGYFGLVDSGWIEASTLKTDMDTYNYEEYLLAARRVSKELRAAGCTMVFAITHMKNTSDEELLRDNLNGITGIFGGHEYTYYIRRENNRFLLKSGSDFDYFSSVNIKISDQKSMNETISDMDAKEDNVYSFMYDDVTSPKNLNNWSFSFAIPNTTVYLNVNIEKVQIDQINGPRNSDFDDFYDREILPIVAESMKSVLQISGDMDAREISIGENESEIGDLIADLLRIDYKVDVSILNSGSIQSQQFFKRNQTLFTRDFIQMLSKQDNVEVVTLTGEDLLKLLEKGVVNLPRPSGNLFCFSGIRIKVDLSKKANERIDQKSLMVGQEVLNPNGKYTVALVSFLKKVYLDDSGVVNHGKEIPNKSKPVFDSVELFYQLPLKPKLVQEFNWFKKAMPNMTLDDLTELENTRADKSVSVLNEADFKSNSLKNKLERTNEQVMKRLKWYSLAESVSKTPERTIFVIKPKKDGRLTFMSQIAGTIV